MCELSMAVEMFGRDEKPAMLLQGEEQALQGTWFPTPFDDLLLGFGSVVGSRVDDLLERDHFLGHHLPDVAHMGVGALDGVQPQKQRHGALAPPATLLGVRAQPLVLLRVGQHQHVRLEILAHIVHDLEMFQRPRPPHCEASVARLDGGRGALFARWKHQTPGIHTRGALSQKSALLPEPSQAHPHQTLSGSA
jgi:hypothetical protein